MTASSSSAFGVHSSLAFQDSRIMKAVCRQREKRIRSHDLICLGFFLLWPNTLMTNEFEHMGTGFDVWTIDWVFVMAAYSSVVVGGWLKYCMEV